MVRPGLAVRLLSSNIPKSGLEESDLLEVAENSAWLRKVARKSAAAFLSTKISVFSFLSVSSCLKINIKVLVSLRNSDSRPFPLGEGIREIAFGTIRTHDLCIMGHKLNPCATTTDLVALIEQA